MNLENLQGGRSRDLSRICSSPCNRVAAVALLPAGEEWGCKCQHLLANTPTLLTATLGQTPTYSWQDRGSVFGLSHTQKHQMENLTSLHEPGRRAKALKDADSLKRSESPFKLELLDCTLTPAPIILPAGETPLFTLVQVGCLENQHRIQCKCFHLPASPDTSICLLPPPQEQEKNLHISVKGWLPVFTFSQERITTKVIDPIPLQDIQNDPVKVIIINQIGCKI